LFPLPCPARCSQAIARDSANHVYFSNRATAHFKLGNWTAALTDADAAIANKRDFAKAYGTRGAALQQLGRLQEAVAAYRAGMAFDSTNATLRGNLADAERQLQARATSGSNGSGGSARPAAPASGAGAGARRPATPVGGVLGQLVLASRLAMLATTVVYVLPLGGLSYSAYYWLLLASAVAHGGLIVMAHGRPQFSAQVSIAAAAA
jgi:tetratricopeptide (TPR) repeat protein